jgi:4-amino-4-deoxy-L-arabinose transferase-like glycosyltransferase
MLHAAWDLPLVSPGTGILLVLAMVGLWATVEEPRLSRGGGARVAAWLGGAALLAAGQAVIYYRVEAKDDVAGLGFALLACGALALWPPLRRGAWVTALIGVLLLLGSSLWMRFLDSRVAWDIYQGPCSGEVPTLAFWAGWSACLGALAYSAAQARPSLAPVRPMGQGAELALLGLVLVVAAALRFYKAADLPQGFWYDEVNLARVIRERVLLDKSAPIYVGEQVENPGAYLWIGAVLFKIFGTGVAVLRVAAGAFGLLALLPFWALARLWVGQRWALAATLVFGVMRWVLIPQRIAFMSGFALFWMLAAFWALWQAQLRPGRGLKPWLLAGLLLGFNLHTYTPARAVPLMAATFLGLQAWRDPVWTRSRREWLALLGGFLLSASPMLVYIALNFQDYLHRAAEVSVFMDVAKTGQPLFATLVANLARHLLMFTYRGDFNARHNLHFYPQADFMLAASLALALPWTLGRAWRDARGRFLCLWIGVMLAAGVLTLPIEAPQSHRCILAAPALALAVIWALRELSTPLATAFDGGLPETVRALAMALLLGVAGLNAVELLVQWPSEESTWEHFSPRANAVMRRIQASEAGTAVYLSDLKHEYQYFGYEWGLYGRFALEPQNRACNVLLASQSVAAQDHGVPVKAYLLIWGQSDVDLDAAFHKEFPDLAVEKADSPYNVPGLPGVLYLAALVPADRVPLAPSRGALPLLYRTP